MYMRLWVARMLEIFFESYGVKIRKTIKETILYRYWKIFKHRNLNFSRSHKVVGKPSSYFNL